MAHNSFVEPGDLTRARTIGAVLDFSPCIWSPLPIVDGITKPVGAERMKRFNPVKQAPDLFTINAVRRRYRGDAGGTIETGKRADVVVIDRNMLEGPITAVHDTKVMMTIGRRDRLR